MPEGDTIHRAARRLDDALAGKTLNRLEAPRLRPGSLPPSGTRVDGVEAHGKHLVVRFEDGRALRTHMRMSGSWHLYRPGEPWLRSRAAARVILEAEDVVAVCFSAPVVEVTKGDAEAIRALGPDLTGPEPDLEEAVVRARREDPTRPIAEVLMDQRIASGIGNVYKSEVLFARRVAPFTSVSAIGDDELRALFATAARLLRRNLTTVRRTTAPGGVAVYRKAGRPCPSCGTTIERARQGRDLPRWTYWCPGCQRPAPTGEAGH